MTWHDFRAGGPPDIYAQHLLASGAPDPAWPANGLPICTLADNQTDPKIVPDGAGGAIIAWTDRRGSTYDIYAQRVTASGALAPGWPASGRALCTATGSQMRPELVPDGSGGAIVTWYDSRGSSYDIYAQHVLASGAVDAAWPANGRAVCTAALDQDNMQITSDGAGGAIIAWEDARAGNSDIYAEHVLSSGVLDTRWLVDGVAVCSAVGDQAAPRIVPSGPGGAIVAWYDRRGADYDIYAQRVRVSGSVDPAWPYNGRAVCTATANQIYPELVPDGEGGAVIAWQDDRSGIYDMYAHRVLQSGAVDAAWPANGRVLCAAAGIQGSPQVVPDGAGGAIVAWSDQRTGANDVYAQRVLVTGAVDAAWPADGRAVCTAGSPQGAVCLAADEGLPNAAGPSVIMAWEDEREDVSDIYAQRVAPFGYLGTPEAEIVSVEDVPNDQGGKVKVSWNASWLDLAADPELDYYDVLRSVPTGFTAPLAASGARVRALGADPTPLAKGDVVAIAQGATTDYWELLASIAPRHYSDAYAYVAATLGDSVAGSNPLTAFMIVARNSTYTRYWPSAPLSGYSIDDLAPAAPAPFTGQYVAGAATLHWNPNSEPDLAGYRLYRGASAEFVPAPANLVAALPDTGYSDAAGAPYVYKLTAVDVHGNESPVATLVPGGALGVGDRGATALCFAAPWPNPADERATLRYTLTRAVTVRLAVYDPAGRLVRELAAGRRERGVHAEAWDLRDGAGRAVGAGLYFVRLEAEGRSLVRRVAVAR